MYNQEDMRRANGLVRRYALILGLGLALLLAAYAAAVIVRKQMLMLAVAIVAFWFSALEICLWLRPATQYRNFLRDMNAGLRRATICTVDNIDPKITLQDGVRVQTLHVILDDGDSRVFYINVSKAGPSEDRRIRLIAYGRHIVQWEELP